jgi:transcriptional regulator with XRE-family HTH domain
MGLWQRIDFLVEEQRTTYRWLSSVAGVSETTLSGWRRTDVEPRAGHCQRIAKALGVTVEYLVAGTDSTDPWLREHRQLIEDLKMLPPDKLADQEEAIHAIAEKVRRELGKASASTGAS